ncbi:MAG: phytanoyl-CoA dioxygenase family protein [Candidatus Latescibacterota bacterium]|nr:phytanoyl-CoA dioxygenase family protein [Candidatus Latescibacterota bacterium]
MQLDDQHLQEFGEDGYLLVENALEDCDLDPVIAEYEAHIDKRAYELKADGKITDAYARAPFNERLVLISRECHEIYPELDIMLLRGKASFEFLRNENLLDMVEAFVGPEIICSPIQHIRAKLPAGMAPLGTDPHVAPWHQDMGVTWEDADPFFILTVWLPLAPAFPENGCLEIIPRTHGGGLLQHVSRAGEGTVIIEEEIPDSKVMTLPMGKGSVLFMHKEIPHRSTRNTSNTVRWSMDLRYQKTGTPTGRPFHPEFVARSRSNPDSELTDWATWDREWAEALERQAREKPQAHRWTAVSAAN